MKIMMEESFKTWGYGNESIVLVIADKIRDPSIKTIIASENII